MSTHGAALTRWRLVLGKSAEAPLPLGSGQLERMDDALDFLYVREAGPDVRRDPEGGQGESQPSVARWLSEVRDLFPQRQPKFSRPMRWTAITSPPRSRIKRGWNSWSRMRRCWKWSSV